MKIWLPLLSLLAASTTYALTGAERLILEQERRAAELFAKAQRYNLRGAPGDAVETLDALVKNYPKSRWAGAAQWEKASLYADNHEHADAFDACQLLIDHFPAYYEAALNLQYDLTKRVLARYEDLARHPDSTKPRSLEKKQTLSEMLRAIIRNGPHYDRVAEAQYLLGVALEKEGKSEEARLQHESFSERHAKHELADDAAYQIAYIDYKAWKRMKGDAPQARRRAEMSLLYFLSRFPESAKAAQANGSLIEIQNAEMRELQRLAEFYENQGREKAAAIYYRSLVQRFPDAIALPGLSEKLAAWTERYPELTPSPEVAPTEEVGLALPPYDPIKYPVMAKPE
ncbi:MAG: outer membrane protein assembly factor BamD [Verrucomicrobiaceae bacterium]|nr:outer membrane protein assembly factor BamD [Verrucomicrobiaceae bacterium]